LDGLIEAATLPPSRGAILREFADSTSLEELRERFFRGYTVTVKIYHHHSGSGIWKLKAILARQGVVLVDAWG
jgi:hypothetical protein